jgi:DNA-binding NtrC family response regulator
MALKTCLLVTDDPDDHLAFSEAVSEVSDKAVVLIILDSQKALSLLMAKTHTPDYIFLDLSMQGIRINPFLHEIRSEAGLGNIPTVVYGDIASLYSIESVDGVTFFDKDYEYSQLKNFLMDFFETRNYQ